MKERLKSKSIKIAGIIVRDEGVIAALDATAHLDSSNRRGALLMAAHLVEKSMLGLKARIQHVYWMPVGAVRKGVVRSHGVKSVHRRICISRRQSAGHDRALRHGAPSDR
jgi:hypothetical protein